MPASCRTVTSLLALAIICLLAIGFSAYDQTDRTVGDPAFAAQTRELVGSLGNALLLTTAVSLIVLLFAGLQVGEALKRRRRAEEALQDTLASVEQKVAERTEALSLTMAELERDATEARRLAEEASQLKDEFLATASHELRTPLNAIVGWVHVLQSGALPDAEQRQHAVDAIDRNARMQTRLIEDLLDVSRMIQGRVSLTVAPLNLRAVVDHAIDTVKPAAAAKQIAISLDADVQDLMVVGDDHRLQQIVWNLLANSVKYTPRGGTIEVAVSRVGSRASVRVKDSGQGIDAALLPHVFEPFRQGVSATMRSGLGLGLAIVRRLVDLHGGRITASSEGSGKGAEFVVTLPMATR